jgi:hypothetical protein
MSDVAQKKKTQAPPGSWPKGKGVKKSADESASEAAAPRSSPAVTKGDAASTQNGTTHESDDETNSYYTHEQGNDDEDDDQNGFQEAEEQRQPAKDGDSAGSEGETPKAAAEASKRPELDEQSQGGVR